MISPWCILLFYYFIILSKAGLALNDLYDTICTTDNRFSDFHCVWTFIQVVHTEFIKVVCTEYPAFKNLSKIRQEQAVAAVIIALISEKNKLRKKRQKSKGGIKPWLKRRKNFYETLLAELQLEDRHNY